MTPMLGVLEPADSWELSGYRLPRRCAGRSRSNPHYSAWGDPSDEQGSSCLCTTPYPKRRHALTCSSGSTAWVGRTVALGDEHPITSASLAAAGDGRQARRDAPQHFGKSDRLRGATPER